MSEKRGEAWRKQPFLTRGVNGASVRGFLVWPRLPGHSPSK